MQSSKLVLSLRVTESGIGLQMCAILSVHIAQLLHRFLWNDRVLLIYRWKQLVYDNSSARHPLQAQFLQKPLGLVGGHHGWNGGNDEFRLTRVAEQVPHLNYSLLQLLQLLHCLVLICLLGSKQTFDSAGGAQYLLAQLHHLSNGFVQEIGQRQQAEGVPGGGGVKHNTRVLLVLFLLCELYHLRYCHSLIQPRGRRVQQFPQLEINKGVVDARQAYTPKEVLHSLGGVVCLRERAELLARLLRIELYGSQRQVRAFNKNWLATSNIHRKRVAERMGRVSGNDESRMAVVCKLYSKRCSQAGFTHATFPTNQKVFSLLSGCHAVKVRNCSTSHCVGIRDTIAHRVSPGTII
mmetsp:Transcript_34179/g.65300  ORF Transcript_34179/g.65300 Transcript_34179/m.65300 type:complete len:351 (-) Transcript_34179:297-1349(-)